MLLTSSYTDFAEGGSMDRIRQLGRAVVAVAVLATLGGCASIPQRAWDNGRNISSSRAYWSMMQGDHSFTTMRSLYGAMDPYRSLYTPAPYTPFARW
jgi:hypothetical protein